MANHQNLGGTSIANGLPIYLPPQTEETLYSLFLNVGRKAVKQAINEIYNPSERYITQQEFIKKFHVGQKQIDEWRKQGLKRVRVGQSYRYDIEDIYYYMDLNKK